ncbi:MAG: UGSC family (seleno)protein, partial [Ilumatobacteraceae bacterium]
DVFVQAAESQANALGFPTVQRVFVPHPIQDRTDDEMRAIADSAYDSIVAAITNAK